MANHVRLLDGSTITRGIFDFRVKKAKQKKHDDFMEEHGYIFCEVEGCGINANHSIIDISHDKSVGSCVQNGYAEKAYDVENMTFRCRNCHKIYDTNLIMPGK